MRLLKELCEESGPPGFEDRIRDIYRREIEPLVDRIETDGLGNVISGLLGGMPMCHGSSGFTAHVRLGARTAAMNLMLGGVFVTLGLVFSNQVLALFGLLPVWTLAGFLAYAGVRHAMLILDLRGGRLAIALVAGVLGIVTQNLAITTAVAIVAEHGPGGARRLRIRRGRH